MDLQGTKRIVLFISLPNDLNLEKDLDQFLKRRNNLLKQNLDQNC